MSYTPSTRLFVILTVLGLLAIGCFVWDWFAVIWLGLLSGLVLLVLTDWWMLHASRLLQLEHRFSHQPTVQRSFRLTIQFLSEVSNPVRFAIEAVQSDMLGVDQLKAIVAITEDGRLCAKWEAVPKERGDLAWPGAIVTLKSPLHLLNKWQTLPAIPIKVYPRLSNSLQTILNPNLLLEQLGVKQNRFRRADQVFESLRPYLVGDNYRHIDWKASARSNTLVTRQFQMEQHHNILVCLDASRLMGTLTEGITKLDWAIEATLHLAYLADHLKDRIGLVVFSNGVDKWVKPQRHPVEAFLGTVYDVRSKIVEADLGAVCTNVLANQKKRSLVIFLSDFMDSSSLQPFLPSFGHLNRKHCSLFIGIEDPAYKKHLGDLSDTSSALGIAQRIVAQDSMNRREAVLQQLRQMGLRTITTTPENLIQRAANAYLEIKMQGAI